MLHYAAVKVADLERSGRFYDSILAPLGWRRHEAPANAVSWGLIKAEFFITEDESQRPGFGQISFPARASPPSRHPSSRAWRTGKRSPSRRGALLRTGKYSCRLNDPDGYTVEICVAHD